MRIINWASPEQLFEELNRTGEYAVLRNWEEYFDDLFMPGHGDIDLLCSRKDRRRIIKATGAFRRTNIFNQWNFWVVISDRLVKFDLRVEGDGYYDIKWERDMLSSRIFDKRGFYRLSDEQYFFSLIYHAAYQKREFAQDYVERLTAMLNGSADDSGRGTDEDSREGTECTDRNSLKEKLEKYMSENGYEYSFVFNPSVYLNLDGVPENRIQKRPTEVANMYTRKSVRLARKWGGYCGTCSGPESERSSAYSEGNAGSIYERTEVQIHSLLRYRSKLEYAGSEQGRNIPVHPGTFVQVSQDQCKEVAEGEGKCRNEVKTIHRYANVSRVLQRGKLNRILYEGLPYVA